MFKNSYPTTSVHFNMKNIAENILAKVNGISYIMCSVPIVWNIAENNRNAELICVNLRSNSCELRLTTLL